MAYLLDSNILIEAKNLYYGFDICPGYWEWVEQAHEDGTLLTIEPVQVEILAKEDELSEWLKQCPNDYFAAIDDDCAEAMTEVSEWVTTQGFKESAVHAFLSKADYFLVAYAKAHGHIIITKEVHSSGKSKVKIPTVCQALGVSCTNIYDLMRNKDVSFNLAS